MMIKNLLFNLSFIVFFTLACGTEEKSEGNLGNQLANIPAELQQDCDAKGGKVEVKQYETGAAWFCDVASAPGDNNKNDTTPGTGDLNGGNGSSTSAGGSNANTAGNTSGSSTLSDEEKAKKAFTIWAHDSKNRLMKLNAKTFEVEIVGKMNTSDIMFDLAVSPDDRIFTVSDDAFYEVDPKTAKVRKIANLDRPPGQEKASDVALTFMPADTSGQYKLLSADKDGGWLREIDVKTGRVTNVGQFGKNMRMAGDLVAVTSKNGPVLFGISDHPDSSSDNGINDTANNRMIEINPLTGKAKKFDNQTGFRSIYGAAFLNNKLYAFNSTGEVVEIDPSTGKGSLLNTCKDKDGNTIKFYGAGVSPSVFYNVSVIRQ